MNYEKQCIIDLIIASIIILKKSWAFIIATIILSNIGAKILEKHFDI